jgi:iron complex transport system substrate-binding protein
MRLLISSLFLAVLIIACKKAPSTSIAFDTTPVKVDTLKYAKGFQIKNYPTHKIITVNAPWPKSRDTFNYILLKAGQKCPPLPKNATVIQLPIRKVIVMSSTNIPALEYLQVDTSLVGFPNTKYISSHNTRIRVEKGLVRDLNNDLDLNMELVLELQPDLVFGFSVNGQHKTLNQIEKFGIPVVLNGAWTEHHPLGRAEWLKFTAAFYDKETLADSIFNRIEQNYNTVKTLASGLTTKPVVTSGSLFKDVWNIPGGRSYMAQFLNDAHTDYIWKHNNTNGSLHLNFESVLEKAQHATLWIGAGSFKTKTQMTDTHNGYSYFDAFNTNNIYTYTKNIGPKGGLLYYELGPLRPDLILKDIIKIAHPELLPHYENFFFKRLN